MNKVIQVNGLVTDFVEHKIKISIKKAAKGACFSLEDKKIQFIVDKLIDRYFIKNSILDTETIQDSIICELFSSGLYKVAKQYIKYKSKKTLKVDDLKKYFIDFYIKFPSFNKRKKISWIISKIASIFIEHNQYLNFLLIEKISDYILATINHGPFSGQVSLQGLSNVTKDACNLQGVDTRLFSFLEDKKLSLEFWSNNVLDIEYNIENLINKNLLLPATLVFSKEYAGCKVYILREHFIKVLDDIENASYKDLNFIKEKVCDLYKKDMNLYSFYSSVANLYAPCIEEEPHLSCSIAQLLIEITYLNVCPNFYSEEKKKCLNFKNVILKGIEIKRFTSDLSEKFDLEELEKYIDHSRDYKFKYMGASILIDRYLTKEKNEIIETPQMMFMRVAMGISIGDSNKYDMVRKTYDFLSKFEYMPSTPTLFNSGLNYAQMSACFLSTVRDSLPGIMQSLYDSALMSKWGGGVGIDWTYVRAEGSKIAGTDDRSQGIIPFIQIMNSLCGAVNQMGKRKGAAAAYLEVWHKDIFAFIDLRKPTGDERLRARDMSHAVWVPDLFMKRVAKDGFWTLFCPSEAVGLHDSYGKEFEELYKKYEQDSKLGKINGKEIKAVDLYKKILLALFETGHPWIVFKDPANICYTQKHEGVVKSSNLCTEIFEHATPNCIESKSDPEIGVCTIGSINLLAHLKDKKIDWERLKNTVKHAVRMLDNCIDNNFYSIKATNISTKKHRFIGLGQCGWHDTLIVLGIPFESEEMIKCASEITEFITYHAISASSELSKERGSYPTFNGSEWSNGVVPIDMFSNLEKLRGEFFIKDNIPMKLNWCNLRAKVKNGMRNALTCAIAPTVTVSPIMGVSDSIAPLFGVMYTKTNLSGSFVYISDEVYNLLRSNGLWSAQLVEDLKYYDGSIQQLKYIPDYIKNLLKGAFEIDPLYLVRGAAIRQKFIDQGQSVNLFFPHNNGKLIMDAYQKAFLYGLKSTYYMRSRGASTIEKATVDVNVKGVRPLWARGFTSASNVKIDRVASKQCAAEDGCESCQ